MFFNQFVIYVVLSVLCLKTYVCYRRIQGAFMKDEKRYLVYLIPSNLSKLKYDTWLCGGCIVTPRKILTTASCLMEVENIYVIAGMKTYVPWRQIDHDECTKRWKQRVIQTSLPKLNKPTEDKKSIILDIGIAVVEKSYNFLDITYRLHCSYVPSFIKISFEPNEEAVGTFVVMMGWGSNKMREVDNQNRRYPFAALSRICEKARCLELANYRHYSDEFKKLIENHMVCVEGIGFVNSHGDLIISGNTTNYKCTRRQNVGRTLSPECAELNELEGNYDFDEDYEFRKNIPFKNKTLNNKSQKEITRQLNLKETRRSGICQNDHGGPLVTWAGNTETVIGIALTRFPHEEIQCNGPYFFISTYAASDLIMCLLTEDPIFLKQCESNASEKSYGVEHKFISWNENLELEGDRDYDTVDVNLRPQKPIRS